MSPQDWETGIYTALLPILEQSKTGWTKKEALTAFGSVETDLQVRHPDMLYSDLLTSDVILIFSCLSLGVYLILIAKARAGAKPKQSGNFQEGYSTVLSYLNNLV